MACRYHFSWSCVIFLVSCVMIPLPVSLGFRTSSNNIHSSGRVHLMKLKYGTIAVTSRCCTTLRARAAKPEPAKRVDVELVDGEGSSGGQPEDDDMIAVPYNGLIGYETGQLFQKPLEKFDATATPTKNTDDLPGQPGSDERNDAIVARIKQRVEDLKQQDEWRNDDQDFGKNPLQNIPLTEVMVQQLKVIRPFESFSEFALTLTLLIITTGFLTVFININNGFDEQFIKWWTGNDFDVLSGFIRES